MNLFNNPSLSELSGLLDLSRNCSKEFYIIVEHDGEVLLMVDKQKSKNLLRKYKFYIKGLYASNIVDVESANNLKYINQLFKNLIFCWEKNLKGAIDFDKITKIQNISLWLEVKNISKAIKESIVSFQLKKVTHEHGSIA